MSELQSVESKAGDRTERFLRGPNGQVFPISAETWARVAGKDDACLADHSAIVLRDAVCTMRAQNAVGTMRAQHSVGTMRAQNAIGTMRAQNSAVQ